MLRLLSWTLGLERSLGEKCLVLSKCMFKLHPTACRIKGCCQIAYLKNVVFQVLRISVVVFVPDEERLWLNIVVMMLLCWSIKNETVYKTAVILFILHTSLFTPPVPGTFPHRNFHIIDALCWAATHFVQVLGNESFTRLCYCRKWLFQKNNGYALGVKMRRFTLKVAILTFSVLVAMESACLLVITAKWKHCCITLLNHSFQKHL